MSSPSTATPRKSSSAGRYFFMLLFGLVIGGALRGSQVIPSSDVMTTASDAATNCAPHQATRET